MRRHGVGGGTPSGLRGQKPIVRSRTTRTHGDQNERRTRGIGHGGIDKQANPHSIRWAFGRATLRRAWNGLTIANDWRSRASACLLRPNSDRLQPAGLQSARPRPAGCSAIDIEGWATRGTSDTTADTLAIACSWVLAPRIAIESRGMRQPQWHAWRGIRLSKAQKFAPSGQCELRSQRDGSIPDREGTQQSDSSATECTPGAISPPRVDTDADTESTGRRMLLRRDSFRGSSAGRSDTRPIRGADEHIQRDRYRCHRHVGDSACSDRDHGWSNDDAARGLT